MHRFDSLTTLGCTGKNSLVRTSHTIHKGSGLAFYLLEGKTKNTPTAFECHVQAFFGFCSVLQIKVVIVLHVVFRASFFWLFIRRFHKLNLSEHVHQSGSCHPLKIMLIRIS